MSQLVDLSKLPAPDVIEELDYETLLAERKAKFISLYPESEQTFWQARLSLESEPITKLLEENAYLELILRARINHAARAVMLAFATGADLDHLGALMGVQRLLIQAEDLSQEPPQPAIYEDDERFRLRIQMSLEGRTTAGSRGSYLFHTLSVSTNIRDANISSPTPGTVLVTILPTLNYEGNRQALLDAVKQKLNQEDIRPLTDTVEVTTAEQITYQVTAELTMYPSAIESVSFAAAQSKLNTFVEKQYYLGRDITLSGIYVALHQEGVQNVHISQPVADIVVEPKKVAYCTAINITIRGRDE